MNDSADMLAEQAAELKSARERLDSALSRLADRLGPVSGKMADMERQLVEAESFKTDRADLAARLDEVTAQAQQQEAAARQSAEEHARTLEELRSRHTAREQEFLQLAQESKAEIADIERRVADALGQD